MEATIDDIEIERVIDIWDQQPVFSGKHPEERMNVFWKFTKEYPDSFPSNRKFTGGNSMLPIEDSDDGYKRAILKELRKLWTL